MFAIEMHKKLSIQNNNMMSVCIEIQVAKKKLKNDVRLVELILYMFSLKIISFNLFYQCLNFVVV